MPPARRSRRFRRASTVMASSCSTCSGCWVGSAISWRTRSRQRDRRVACRRREGRDASVGLRRSWRRAAARALAVGSARRSPGEHAPVNVTDAWHAAGAKVETLPSGFDGHGVELQHVLWLLGRLGVLQAMFEGGSTVHAALLDGLFVDHVTAYVAPTFLAGGLAAFGPRGRDSMAPHAARYQFVEARRVGSDLRIDLEQRRGDAA